MSYSRDKQLKIMNEVVNFCFKIGMNDLNINFSCIDNIVKIVIEGECSNPPKDKLDKLDRILNTPRKEELEELYWSLVGDPQQEAEFEMIGVMVDHGEVEQDGNHVKISIYRDENRRKAKRK